MNWITFVSLFISIAATIEPSWAITPMEYYNSLVAGGGGAGFRDGDFSLARFTNPSGLAFDNTGNQLYVADSGNHRIRVVYLDQNNVVKTLAGSDTAGSTDGPFSNATFNIPNKLAALSGRRLAVYDFGSGSIRLMDLQKQTVSTIAKGINLQDMVYQPQDDSLYFSENGQVQKMEMKSLLISTVFSNNPQVPNPGALCLYHDHLCVADSTLPTIYEVIPGKNQSSAMVSVSLSAVGNAKDVLELCSTDGFLYALQRGGFLVKVGLPDSNIVQFPTPWGFLFKNHDHGFFWFLGDNPGGFLASPSEPRKFFISTGDSILSVKDYNFEQWWAAYEVNGRPLTDFDYPTKKPARTFRILVMGSSRNSTAVSIPSDTNAPINENAFNPKVSTYPKQLEFFLNTEASLRNLNVHFEVLNLTRRGIAISSFAYTEVPDLVKKYDIDLVLGLADHSGYWDYYKNPITSEGIPARSFTQDYMQKPLSQRASGAALDLIKRFKQLKMSVSEKQDFPGTDADSSIFCIRDAQIENDLIEMTGRRLELLNEKLNSMKTSGGNRPRLVLFYVPDRAFSNDGLESFWNDLCAHFGLKFLDLAEPYNALKISYYPTVATDHHTVYGNELIALLLKYYLIKNGLVPF